MRWVGAHLGREADYGPSGRVNRLTQSRLAVSSAGAIKLRYRARRRRRMIRTFSVVAMSLFVAITGNELLAQSGYRGSTTRPSTQTRGSLGRPSRVGGARSSITPRTVRPNGMVNSSRSAQVVGRAQVNRPVRTTGITSDPTTGSFSPTARYAPTPNLTRARPVRRPPTTTATASAAISAKLAEEGFRTWSDASGRFSVIGKLVTYRANTVWIRRSDGRLAQVPLTQLSEIDQQFVRSPPKTKPAQDPPTEAGQ